ncbi:hemolysin family protein [Ornithinimicrobium sufpigmenti]|uniref:hemolysin family protein n=1 Tax=Ornithinimicrobium sufpigmenti TaxID=2508882 RepID=UPI001035E834|nr:MULTISPECIES: hemolysin family protein [unclassified Ornithinimicrobium]
MTIVLSLLLGVLVVLAITAATGYFVAQEFAYMAVDRSRLSARAEAGDPVAARALAVTKRTSFMLSGAQLGITVTGLLVGYVAEPLIGSAFGQMLGGVGVPAGVGVAIGTVLALLFATVVQMVFGELFPKNLAIARPEPLARGLSRTTIIYLKVFGWLIWIFDQSSNLLLKALGIEPVHDVEHSATARDLEHIVADSRDSGDLPDELSDLLDRILDFPTRDVGHAMIPRSRVDTVRETDSLTHVRSLMATGHSRYPVLSADGEDVVGMVEIHEVMAAAKTAGADGADVTVADLQRPALVLPESMTLPNATRELAEFQNQMACVIDEYGGFTGILTLEDLAEEIVGEITDEHDQHPDVVPDDDDGVWVMGGDVHVDEIERALNHDLPRGDYETIAGLVITEHGDLPEPGLRLSVELPPDPADLVHDEPRQRHLQIEVLEIERHVPALVRLTILEDGPTNPDRSTQDAAADGPTDETPKDDR